MTQLFGYWFPHSRTDEIDTYTAYASTMCSAEDAACAAKARAWCTGPEVRSVDGLLVAFRGRPIWAGKKFSTETAEGIAEEIGRAYLERNDGVLADLEGPFALAIIDSAARRVFLAIDRMGIERLTYARSQGGIVFGTSARTVSGFPTVDRKLRDQALYDFLFTHMVPAPSTVYAGVDKLPAASVLTYRDGDCSIRRYWQPRYDYVRSFPELQDCLEQSLATAMRASDADEHTGTFLSGGLDSSTITGVLAQQSGHPVKTFSVGFGESTYDELHYARVASRHFACKAFEYQLQPGDIVDALPRIAASYDEPFGNSSAVPTFYCAKLAADSGVTHLLAGDGGDELFGGNERYAKQQVFDFYGHIPRWLRRALLEPLAHLTTPESRVMPLRKLKSYVEQASIPLPDRFESWNFVYREGRARLLDPDFAASINIAGPLDLMREVWEAAPSRQVLERMLWYDWRFTLADNDLRKVGTMCELAGVRVSYPMLHPAVVDLSTRVPPDMKMKRLELRSFFRRAVADLLPEETLSKKKHGFGLPFGVWLKTNERLGDMIYSLLSDLKKRRIVSAQFLTDLVDEHRAGHASYYGYVIWDLAMLEAWLAHSDAAYTGSK